MRKPTAELTAESTAKALAAKDAASAATWVHERALKLWQDNPRINDGRPVRKVAESIRRFGFVAPVVVWSSRGQMVAGHTRLKALRSILAEEPDFIPAGAPAPGMVPTRYHEFKDEHEAMAYAIADNRLSYEAEWDYEKLVVQLGELGKESEQVLASTGFDQQELDALLRSHWSADSAAHQLKVIREQAASVSGGSKVITAQGQALYSLRFTAEQWETVLDAVAKFSPGDKEGAELSEAVVNILGDYLDHGP